MSEVLYLKLNQNTEVHEKEVFLSQLGSIWCRDKAIESKCKAIKVMNIHANKKERYVVSVMDLITRMEKLCEQVEINNIGTTIGPHTGPGTVALFFWGDVRND